MKPALPVHPVHKFTSNNFDRHVTDFLFRKKMKRNDKFNFAAAEKMQKAAAERVASLNINLNKFDKNKNGPGRLVHRHRNQWKISWENISFDENIHLCIYFCF